MSETGPGPNEEELAVWQPYQPEKPRSRTELPALSEAAMADPNHPESVRRREIGETTLSGELKPRKGRAELWRQKNVADANEHWRKTMNPATPEEQAEQDRYNELRVTNMAEADGAAAGARWSHVGEAVGDRARQARANVRAANEAIGRAAVRVEAKAGERWDARREAENALPAVAKLPEGPERAELTARVNKYVEELEREEVFARINGGISTVEIDNPDDDLRRALYKKFGVKEAEVWYDEADRPTPKVWQGLMSTASTPMRAVRYVQHKMTGLRPSDAAGTHFEVRRYLVGSDNETVIEESFHQLQAGVEGDGKPGDLSLASTRLIRVKGGAYEENKRGNLVPSKAFEAYQKLPRTKTPGMYQDLEPLSEVALPPEGPRPGSLPRDEVFPPQEAPDEPDDEGAEEEYRLPPAPELRRPAVSPTPRPVAPFVPERTSQPETATVAAAPKAEVKPPDSAAAGGTAKEAEPEPQPSAGGSSEPAPTSVGPDSGSEAEVEAEPTGDESEPGESVTAETAPEKQPIVVLVSGRTQPPPEFDFSEEQYYESSEAAAVFGAVPGDSESRDYDRFAAQVAKTAVQVLLKRPLDINNAEAVLAEAGMKLDSTIRQDSRSQGKSWSNKRKEEMVVLGQTTLAAVKFLEDGRHAGVLSVGDSRVYRMRGDVLVALTKDDNNFLGGRVGGEGKQIQDFQSNVRVTDVELGDRFILLTGGVHHNLSEQEIRTIVRGAGSPEEVSAQLLAAVTAKLSDYSGQEKAPLETSTADATVVSMFVRQPEVGVEPGGGEHAVPEAAPSGAEVAEPLAEAGEAQKGEDPEITKLIQSVRQKYPDFDVPGSGQLLPAQVERMAKEADTPTKFEAIRKLIRSRSAQSSQDEARISPARGDADESQASVDARIAGLEAALLDIVKRKDTKLQREHLLAERALLRAETERLRVAKERLVGNIVPEVKVPPSFQDDYDADRAASERNSSGNVVNYRVSRLPRHRVGTSESDDADVRQAVNMASERRKLADKTSRTASTDKAQAGSKIEKPKRGSGRGEQVGFRIDARALRKVDDQAVYEQTRDALIAEALSSGYIVKDEGARLGVRRSADPKSVEFIHELMEGWQTAREAKGKRGETRRTKAKQPIAEIATEPDIGSTSEAAVAQAALEKAGADAEVRKEIVSRIIALPARKDVDEGQREIEFAYLIKEAIDAGALGAYRKAGLGFRALSNNDESTAYAKQIRSAYEQLDLAKPERPGKLVSGVMNNEDGEAAAAPTFATEVTQPEITSSEPNIEPLAQAPELVDDPASSAEAADSVELSDIEDRMATRLNEIREITDAKGRRAKIKRVSKEAGKVGLAEFTDGVLSPLGEPGSIHRIRSEQFIQAMEALSTASVQAAEDETEITGHDRSTENVREARQARDNDRREANNNGSKEG